MNLYCKRTSKLLVCCVLVLFLPGCWDYESINTRASIVGVAIDPAPNDPNQIALTVQYPNLNQGGGGGATGQSGQQQQDINRSYVNVSATADSVAQAMSKVQLKTDRHVDFSQIRMVVFSNSLSPRMMSSLQLQLIRQPKVNQLAFALVSNGSAQAILQTPTPEVTPSDYVDKLLRVRQRGYVVRRELWEFWRDTTQIGAIAVLPVIQQVEGTNGSPTLAISKLVAFNKSGKSILTVSADEAFYINLLLGTVRDMSFDVPIGKSAATLDEMRASSHLKCIDQGKNIILVDDVSVVGTLTRVANQQSVQFDDTNVKQIENATGIYLTKQLTETLKLLQEHRADVIGYGALYLRQHPWEASQLLRQWGEMFQQAQPDIHVKVKLTSKGMLI